MININQGYQLKSPVPSFTRDQVSLISDLLGLSDNDYPDIYYIYCLEDRKRYKFDKNNSVDPLTGKCRLDEDARIDDILDDLDTKVDRGFNHTWTIRKNSTATEDGIKCSKILSLPEGQSIILNYSISEGPGGGHSGTLFFYTSTYNSCTTLESTGFTYKNTSWQSGGVSHRYFGYINQDSNYPYSNGTIKFQVVFCSCPMDQITWYDEAVSYNKTNDYKYASTIAYYPKPSSMYNAVQVIISNSDRLAGFNSINMESNVDFSIKKASDLPEGFYFKADPIDTTKMFRFAVDEVVNPFTVKDSGGNVLFSYEEDLYPGDILTAVPPLLEGDEWAISVDKSKIVSSDDSITLEDMEGRTDLTVTPRFHFITNSTANYPSFQTGTSVAFLAYKIYRHPTEWIQATMMITGDLSPLDESTMEQDQRVAEYLIPPLSDTRWGNKISATFQGSDRAMSNHFRYLVPNYLWEKNTPNPEYFIIGGTTGSTSFTAPFEYAASLISITPCAKIEEVNVLTQNYWNSYSSWECWRSNLLGTGIASSYGDSYLEDFLVSMAYCNGLVASLGSRIDGCMKFVGTKTEEELDSLTEPCCGFTNITIDNVSQGGVFMRMYTGVYSYIVFTNWNGITFQKRVGGTVWGTLRMSASDGTMNVVQDTNMGTVQLSLKATKGNSGTINFNGDSSTKKHLLLSFTGSNNNLLEENVSLLTQLKNYNGDVVTLLISHARIATYDTAPLRVQVLQGDKSLIEGKVNLYHRSSSAPEEYIVWEQAPNEDTWTILMNTLLSYNVREGRTEGLENLYLANGEDVTSLLEGIPAPNTCYYYSYEPSLEEYQKITDNTLETTSNTVPGAINEILGVVNSLKQRAYTLDFGTDSELAQDSNLLGSITINNILTQNVSALFLSYGSVVRQSVPTSGTVSLQIPDGTILIWEIVRATEDELACVSIRFEILTEE